MTPCPCKICIGERKGVEQSVKPVHKSYDLWYKGLDGVPYHCGWADGMRVVTVPPDSQAARGYYLVVEESTNHKYIKETVRQLKQRAERLGYTPLQEAIMHLIEHLDSLMKNDYHPPEKIDPPNKEVLPQLCLGLPRTLQEVRIWGTRKGIGPLGRAVGQLLASGNVRTPKSLTLLQRLSSLALECDKLHQELADIPDEQLRQADEAVAAKK